MKTIISTENAPKAIGPYSQATKANGFLFLSGQLPIDPATGNFPNGGIKEQTTQSFENIKAILEEAGTSFENVVKTTVLLNDIADFSDMNEIYSKYFSKECPARSAFQVANLPKAALVEIELIATID